MCDWHTLRGNGRRYRDPWPLQRALGVARRYGRHFVPDEWD